MKKPIRLTQHALENLLDRKLPVEWVERVTWTPQWVEADPRGDGAERRYGPIIEAGSRTLRVVCVETTFEIRVIACYFDRDALRRRS